MPLGAVHHDGDMLTEWRRELRMLVAELAAIDRWSAEYRAYIFYLVEHQPSLSTVRDDLTWFRDRPNVVRSRAAQDVQQQPPPVILRSGTGECHDNQDAHRAT